MLLNVDIEKSSDEERKCNFEYLPFLEFIIEPRSLSKYAVCLATGMSFHELEVFLNNRKISHSGVRVDYDALSELKEWYLKKMRRYVRNTLAHKPELGSKDDILFLDFCITYHKFGHNVVSSWDDIDEYRLIQDFEAKCLETLSPLDYEYVCNNSLVDRIHRSFLFHLRLKKSPEHRTRQSNICLSFILCNRYHIFIGETDSNADKALVKAYESSNQWFNPPRRTAPYVLAS